MGADRLPEHDSVTTPARYKTAKRGILLRFLSSKEKLSITSPLLLHVHRIGFTAG